MSLSAEHGPRSKVIVGRTPGPRLTPSSASPHPECLRREGQSLLASQTHEENAQKDQRQP